MNERGSPRRVSSFQCDTMISIYSVMIVLLLSSISTSNVYTYAYTNAPTLSSLRTTSTQPTKITLQKRRIVSPSSKTAMKMAWFTNNNNNDNDMDNMEVNNAGSASPAASASAGDEQKIVLTSSFLKDKASLLESAFDAMDDKDKYDAVLTGLCSKILDGESTNTSQGQSQGQAVGGENDTIVDDIASSATLTPTELAMKKMQGPIQLLEEMNMRRVKASSRSLMALLDATTTTNDPRTISKILSLTLKNGSLSYYGSLQSTINPLPPTQTSKVPNSSMTRQQRLNKLVDVPTDDRAKEVTSALATMGIVGTSFILQGIGNGLGLDELSFYTTFFSYGIIGVLLVDNFFDAIQAASSFVVKMNSDKLPDAVKNANGPDKDSMPLELGSGKITGTIVRGLTRLFSADTERECQCEAAAFYTAYSLGLPCFSFRANALEAAVLLYESQDDNDDRGKGGRRGTGKDIDSLLSDTGIMKMLIWLMAPVAIESSFHPQLITSDPREARGFLLRLKEKASLFGAEDAIESILQTENGDGEIEDLLKWSYAEADLLLRQNRAVVTELTERLIGGASTISDCAAVLEQW